MKRDDALDQRRPDFPIVWLAWQTKLLFSTAAAAITDEMLVHYCWRCSSGSGRWMATEVVGAHGDDERRKITPITAPVEGHVVSCLLRE